MFPVHETVFSMVEKQNWRKVSEHTNDFLKINEILTVSVQEIIEDNLWFLIYLELHMYVLMR